MKLRKSAQAPTTAKGAQTRVRVLAAQHARAWAGNCPFRK